MTDFARYQHGGDLYSEVEARYGSAAARRVAAAAATGDLTQLNLALSNARQGRTDGPLNESTLGLFAQQISTDPLAAPLQGLNRTLGRSFLALLQSPWVLLSLALIVAWKLGVFERLAAKK